MEFLRVFNQRIGTVCVQKMHGGLVNSKLTIIVTGSCVFLHWIETHHETRLECMKHFLCTIHYKLLLHAENAVIMQYYDFLKNNRINQGVQGQGNNVYFSSINNEGDKSTPKRPKITLTTTFLEPFDSQMNWSRTTLKQHYLFTSGIRFIYWSFHYTSQIQAWSN